MKVREANRNDYDQICEVLQQLSDYKPNSLPEWFQDQKNIGIVLEDNSNIIGYASYHIIKKVRGGNIAVIEDVVIDKDYRNRGYAKKLISRIIEDIKHIKNVYKIILESSPEGEYLYKSCGFEISKNNIFFKYRA